MNAAGAQILELIAQGRVDLEALDRSAGEVAALHERVPEPSETSPEVILYGYHLHQWYTAAEDLLKRIAAHFGNTIESSEWRREVLARLKQDVPRLRPPVFSEESFEHLNAFRGFRHIFRHTYDYRLKWHLMLPNVLRLADAHRVFTADIERFLAYLKQLADQAGDSPATL